MKAAVLPILACLSAALVLPSAALSMTGEEVEHLYVEALRTAGAKEDLGLYWSTLLSSGPLDEGSRRQVLHEMLEGGAEAAALPYLAQEASSSEEWLFAYAEAAERVGARAELARFLTAELSRRELSSAGRELRRSLLVEKAAAEAAPLLAPLASGDPLLASTYQDVLEALGRKRELAAFLLARAADRELTAAERLSLGWRFLELGRSRRPRPLSWSWPAGRSPIRQKSSSSSSSGARGRPQQHSTGLRAGSRPPPGTSWPRRHGSRIFFTMAVPSVSLGLRHGLELDR